MAVRYNEVIMDAFLELCRTIPIGAIQIPDILEASGVSRQTFYNHFRSKRDLTETIFVRRVVRAWESALVKMEYFPSAVGCFERLEKYRSFLGQASKVISARSMKEEFMYSLESWNLRHFEGDQALYLQRKELLTENRYSAAAMANIIFNWIQGEIPGTPETMAFYAFSAKPDLLRSRMRYANGPAYKEEGSSGYFLWEHSDEEKDRYFVAVSEKKQRARERFVNALILLSKEIPLEEVTVQKLLNRTGISRPTFYRHFRDKNDLVQYAFCSRVLIPCQAVRNEELFYSDCEDYYMRMEQDKEFLRQALRDEGQNCFMDQLSVWGMNWYYRQYRRKYPNMQVTKELAFAVAYHAYGFAMLIQDWINGESQASSAAEMALLARRCIPRIMKDPVFGTKL